MFEARKMIGICPQLDIHFDVLTVEENLSILASIKGIPANDVIQEVCYLCRNLYYKLVTFCSNLCNENMLENVNIKTSSEPVSRKSS